MIFDNVHARVVGVVLNSVKPEVGPDYFKYHSYQYYSASEEKKPFSIGGGIGRVMKTVVIPAAIALILIGAFIPGVFGG
jgi:hypothetical protein